MIPKDYFIIAHKKKICDVGVKVG